MSREATRWLSQKKATVTLSTTLLWDLQPKKQLLSYLKVNVQGQTRYYQGSIAMAKNLV